MVYGQVQVHCQCLQCLHRTLGLVADLVLVLRARRFVETCRLQQSRPSAAAARLQRRMSQQQKGPPAGRVSEDGHAAAGGAATAAAAPCNSREAGPTGHNTGFVSVKLMSAQVSASVYSVPVPLVIERMHSTTAAL